MFAKDQRDEVLEGEHPNVFNRSSAEASGWMRVSRSRRRGSPGRVVTGMER